MRNALLVVIASAVTLLAAEGALRLLLSPSQLYSNLLSPHEWRSWRNQVRFWDKKSDQNEEGFAGYDPGLGWDIGVSGDRYRHHNLGGANLSPSQTIVTIGDSFTFGVDVGPKESYPYYLDALTPDARVLNMGVPGYGIDQAYLKFMRFGLSLKPDVVVFGVYVGDYKRTNVDFDSYAKPRFAALADGGWTLANQPVPPPQVMLRQTAEQFEGRWYLLELAANAWHKLISLAEGHGEFYAATDELIAYLLTSLRDALNGGARLLIVHIPRAESFIERDADHEEISRRLLAIYQAVGVQVVDLSVEFLGTADSLEVYRKYYVHFEDGSVGHLSADGNQVVANLILQALE